MSLYSHLRVSSEYSISQGLLTVEQIVKNAVEKAVPSVALTDRANMFGLVKFFNKCESSGIKPISGCSINVIFDDEDQSYELLCLAKTNKGHKNLMKIISNAHNNKFYSTPIIKFNDLINLRMTLLSFQEVKEVTSLNILEEIIFLMQTILLINSPNTLKMILF